jgi:metallo-beta-lactamase family protein
MEKFKLKFLGAAGTVTGSKIVLEYRDTTILIDCGLFQGLKDLRKLNWEDLPVDPSKIDYVLLTHAHLDHCGYLPLLVKNGFKGQIYATQPTIELAELILLDSGKIQEEDANRANKYGFSRHTKALPLYTQDDAIRVSKYFSSHDYEEWVILKDEIKFVFHNAGHIVGSAMIEVKVNKKTILFSGDLGRKDPLLLYPADKDIRPDYLVIESTYGDRIHGEMDAKEKLLETITSTIDKRGTLMIPAFAVERTQEIIYLLYQLRNEGRLKEVPIYLDSPMARAASDIYQKHDLLTDISKEDRDNMFREIHIVQNYEESESLVRSTTPKIIIAGSGMLEGGRILNYLKQHLDKPESTLLFCGYQATGTRGRSLIEGAQTVKLHGDYYPVNCRIESISNMSAHADQSELLAWISNFKTSLKEIFLNHGEPHQSQALRVAVKTKFNLEPVVPYLNESFKLDAL